MELITPITLYGLIFSYFIGQLFRVNFLNISFPLIDIFIVLFSATNLYYYIRNNHLKSQNNYFLYFIIYCWLTLILSFFIQNHSIVKPVFYLIRLSSIILLFIYPPVYLTKYKYFTKILYLSIFANILFGLIQYIFWPDFTSFKTLNWDPHLYRLVSTYFDPTYTGLIYLFFLIYLYFSGTKYFGYKFNTFLMITTYLAIALTYSRSTFLSLIIVSLFVSIQFKHLKLSILTILLVLITIFLLPRNPGEGTKLERTSSVKAKIENYIEGFTIFAKSPIVGHGYNNLPYVRTIKNSNSHCISGFDSSLLTIASTTGIVGLTFFLLGFHKMYTSSSILKKSLLIAVFVHSLFANSLLYPWILILLLII